MKPTALTIAALLLSMGLAGAAHAQTTGGPTNHPSGASSIQKIDPKLGLLEHVVTTEGTKATLFGPDGAPATVRDDGVVASIRVHASLSPADIADFEQRGVRFQRTDGKVDAFGKTYSALVEWRASEFLAGHPDVARVEVEWYPTETSPLEVTGELVGAAQARRLPEMSVDGEGVVVADIDSGIDVLHPHFFKADGGWYDWVDVDEDGKFTPGIDAVDMNSDGTLGRAETLEVLDGTVLSRNFQDKENDDGVFQPRRDWVYVDSNVDGTRNAGPSAGFTESQPAYGEPIFVGDDVNRNGMLDVGEKLVRLDTSKIQKFVVGDTTFERGYNLIEAAELDNATPFHGTGVASIVVGGQAGFHDRVGLAPGAEMIMYSIPREGDQQRGNDFSTRISYLDDAVESGASMILHEWTDLVSMPPDGSSNLEGAMDEARERGLLQVNPLGNMNKSRKHLERDLVPGEALELKFEVGDGYGYQGQQRPFSVAYGGLFWKTDQELDITFISPTGEEVQVGTSETQTTLGADNFYSGYQVTGRNTHHLAFYAWKEDYQQSIAKGEWTIRIEGIQQAGTLFGRVADYYSGWARGIGWLNPTEDSGTMVFPSTADSAIGVAAYGGRHEGFTGSSAGELRGYSGRGPRMDGARGVDIAAPDDPYAALSYTEEYAQYGVGRGWLQTFGGTSGAGPHVAAALALLEQQNPDWTADQLEDQLTNSAINDALQPDYGDFPNAHWGFGQVDIFSALYDEPAPTATNQTPIAGLAVVSNGQDFVLDASQSSDPDGDDIQYRFDFEYDGEFDTGWLDDSEIAGMVDAEPGQTVTSRVEVRDTMGLRSGTIADTVVSLPAADTGMADAGAGADAGTGASANATGGGCSGCTTQRRGSPAATFLFVAGLFAIGLLARRRWTH
ncbi:MAG: S8 family serine peptidase [Myxococcota bacterium]